MIQSANHEPKVRIPPRRMGGTLWRHKGKGLVTFAVIAAGTAAIIFYWPRSYRSEALLFVRLGRDSVTLDPTVTTGQTIALNETRETEINSILEILKSRALAEKVVTAIGPDLILNREASTGAASQTPEWLWAALDKLPKLDPVPVTDHERAATRLENELDVWLPKKTSVIGVRYQAASPEAAQKIVEAVLETYRAEHVLMHRSEHSYTFFDEQKRLLRDQLNAAYAALSGAKNQVGLTSIEGQRLTIQQQTSAIETEAVSAQAELAASQARAAALKRELAEVPAREVTQDVVGFSNEGADKMRDTLFQLQAKQSELQAKFAANHPELVAVNEQIKRMQATLDAQPVQRTQSTTAVNPGHQQLELSSLTEQAAVASLQARVKDLDAQHVAALERAKALNAAEIAIDQAQRQVELTEASYRTYSEKLEQARIDQQLESEQISDVNVIQPASYVAKAATPNRPLVAGLGLVLALASSVLVCFWADAGGDSHAPAPDDIPRAPDSRRVDVGAARATRPRVGRLAGPTGEGITGAAGARRG